MYTNGLMLPSITGHVVGARACTVDVDHDLFVQAEAGDGKAVAGFAARRGNGRPTFAADVKP